MENLPPYCELRDQIAQSASSTQVWDGRKTEMNKCFGVRKMFLAALSALFFALTLGLSSGYSAPATYDMSLRPNSSVKPSESEITWIGSVLALGMMVGGILAGPVADKIGRKDSLIFTIIPSGLGWLLICYADSVLNIIIGRFFCGIANGIIFVVAPMYCVEISTTEVRGLLGSSVQGFVTIGNLISVIIGSYITWEYLALNGLVFSIFGMICFCFMPESPRWLLMKGRLKEAVIVMHELQGNFVDAERDCIAIYNDLENQPKGKLTFEEFTHPTVYKPTLVVLSICFFNQLSGISSVFFYSSEIFEIAKDFIDPNKATVIIGAVQVVATISSNLIVDKVGRRILLILSGIMMALTLATLGVYYYISSVDIYFQNKYCWIPLTSLVMFVIGFSIGYGPVPYLLMAELIPVRARSTVGGMVSFVNGLFTFIVAKSFSELEILLEAYGTFWCYSSVFLLGVIYIVFKLSETKGRKLEEIEALFYRQLPLEQNTDVVVIS